MRLKLAFSHASTLTASAYTRFRSSSGLAKCHGQEHFIVEWADERAFLDLVDQADVDPTLQAHIISIHRCARRLSQYTSLLRRCLLGRTPASHTAWVELSRAKSCKPLLLVCRHGPQSQERSGRSASARSTARTPHHGDLVQRARTMAHTYQIIHIGPRRQDGHPLPDARRQADQLELRNIPVIDTLIWLD